MRSQMRWISYGLLSSKFLLMMFLLMSASRANAQTYRVEVDELLSSQVRDTTISENNQLETSRIALADNGCLRFVSSGSGFFF